jgi:hypothetical protein
MRNTILAAIAFTAFAAPAFAGTYPVSGKWGVSTSTQKGPVDCGKLRVIAFNGNQRTDSGGGVPAYRNRSVTAQDATHFRIVDEFSTGQISAAHVSYTLDKIDDDHIALNMQPGGMLKLRRCK